MTMLFFSLEVAPVSGVCVDHRSGHAAPCRLRRDGTGRFCFGGLFHTLGRGRHEGLGFRATCRLRRGRHEGVSSGLNAEGRLKVARGRSWQPEIGMEHASRGRRSGNKGAGARWRGRFRIFSARHCSKTKVSHAENSGMTMLHFFLWRLLRLVGGCVDHGSGHSAPCHHARGGWFLFFLGGCSGVGGGFFHTLRRDGTRILVFGLGDFFTRSGAAARGG